MSKNQLTRKPRRARDNGGKNTAYAAGADGTSQVDVATAADEERKADH
jgi:hypothetical protein